MLNLNHKNKNIRIFEPIFWLVQFKGCIPLLPLTSLSRIHIILRLSQPNNTAETTQKAAEYGKKNEEKECYLISRKTYPEQNIWYFKERQNKKNKRTIFFNLLKIFRLPNGIKKQY